MFYLGQDSQDNIDLESIEEPTVIEELIASFDWQSISQGLIVAAIRILFTLVVFFIINKIALWGIETLFKRYMGSKETSTNRYETIYRVVKNIYRTIFYFFLVYTILEIFAFPVGTLLASAGVVGLAVSLGAQDFVSDVVNGFTILSGRQLDIGDEVEIEGISGNVLNINLTTTQIKDFDGTIHFIPNREILIISNRSKADMRALIELRLFPNTDTQKVRKIIEEINDEYIPEFSEITVPPSEIVFLANDKNQLTLRVIMYTKPEEQYNVQNRFYEIYVRELSKAGIELPYSDLDIAQ